MRSLKMRTQVGPSRGVLAGWLVLSLVLLGCSAGSGLAAPAEEGDFVVIPCLSVQQVELSPQTMQLRAPGIEPERTVPEGEPMIHGVLANPSPQLDPVAQVAMPIMPLADTTISDPDESFPGLCSGLNPPDTVHDVGPNHVVQMVNSTQFQVWDKEGNPLTGSISFGTLWTPATGNMGDPIVVYDHLADRWLLSQFGRTDPNTNSMYIAISQTPDPSAGSWFLYSFDVGRTLPDYPKFGVWPDGYYMSSYEGANLGIFAFERDQMLLGLPADAVKTTISSLTPNAGRDTRILPADLDGPAPPANAPNFFVRTVDSQQDIAALPGADRLEIWTATVNWAGPTLAFVLLTTINTPALAPFDIMVCDRNGAGARDCIPQPDEVDTIDALSNRPMMQLKYRNFGSHQAMVFNQTINAQAAVENAVGFPVVGEVAGIRWYELRNPGGGWGIQQQSTFAPQPPGITTEDEILHRWMGSAAMDQDGNIALGYSMCNSDSDNGDEVYPGIWYTGRHVSDPLNTMQPEKVILDGVVPQGNGNNVIGPQRWGDYSALTVDPDNDCTFWFTTHVARNGGCRPSQIASFSFVSCSGVDLEITKTDSPDSVIAGTELTYTVTVDNAGPSKATDVVVTDTLPDGVTVVTSSVPCIEAPPGVLTCSIGDIDVSSPTSFTVTVFVDSELVANAGGPALITNLASVTAEEFDLNTTNNATAEPTLVVDEADLSIVKTDDPDPVIAGFPLTFTLVVSNAGPSAARSPVVVRDFLPAGFLVVSETSNGAYAPGVPGNAALPETWTYPMLPVGAVETITLELKALNHAEGVLTNVADVASPTPDPDAENNAVVEDTTVLVPLHMHEPGSLLVFPLIDNTGNRVTLVNLSNSGSSGVWLGGLAVLSHPATPEDFVKRDFYIHLTPHEPVVWDTALGRDRVDAQGIRTQIMPFDGYEGFVVLWAIRSPISPYEIESDGLRGDAILVLDAQNIGQYNAIPHQAIDVIPDRVLMLDGREYSMASSRIGVDGFAEGIVDDGKLAVCNLHMDLIWSVQPTFVLNLEVYNQYEIGRSRHFNVYQFKQLDFTDDLAVDLASVFTPKWHLNMQSTVPLWAAVYQTLGPWTLSDNVWHDRASSLPAMLVLPPAPSWSPGVNP